MSYFLAAITIFTLSVCGPDKAIIIEDLKVEKVSNSKMTKKTVFKKIPTKWSKITKKSN